MIGVAGAGAFGTALAIALAQAGREVVLWARDPARAAALAETRVNSQHLPEAHLPENVTVTAEMAALSATEAVLIAVPMQQLRQFLAAHGPVLDGRMLVACCKGIDLETGLGPVATLAAGCPESTVALLTGPSFAVDIARGLPTALTLAGGSERLQQMLSTPALRLYLTDDVIGAELGGALKNVIAIAAGVVIGAGLGASARAALMARGFAEMVRVATSAGARAETLAGLSGLGDLILTATSHQSRNYCYGMALARGERPDPAVTVEGAATALAVARQAKAGGLDLPITEATAALILHEIELSAAIETLMSRPLKKE